MLHNYDTNLKWFHMLDIYDTNFLLGKYVSGNELRLKCKIHFIVLWSLTQNSQFGIFSSKNCKVFNMKYIHMVQFNSNI